MSEFQKEAECSNESRSISVPAIYQAVRSRLSKSRAFKRRERLKLAPLHVRNPNITSKAGGETYVRQDVLGAPEVQYDQG